MATETTLQNLSIPIPNIPLSIDVEYKAKSSYPICKSVSPEGTIGALIAPPTYSEEQHETWALLLKKHAALVHSENFLCNEYKEGLRKIQFTPNHVSHLNTVSEVLKTSTGWQIVRADGLVAPEMFFKLLANKLFPCTDFIRHREEMDYTPAPDTFHDQIGHLPMITNQRFADFFHLFGLAGTQVRTEEELEWFNRIYWFTVEFGLINPTVGTNHYNAEFTQIYGAGIASSCGEIINSLSPTVKKSPFDLDVITKTEFDIHHMQELLFEISTFDALEQSFHAWAIKHNFLPT